MTDQPTTVFSRLSRGRYETIGEALHAETVGGLLLIGGAAIALIWANTPFGDSYRALMEFHLGPSALGLHLSVAEWAADALLAVFFFVAGLELKRELVVGDLRNPRQALLPVIAASCGVAVPAGVYLIVTAGDPAAMRGWAIPAATDIAFALAVLAVIGSHLPRPVRAFLLTLAVVDDLIAIAIIALFYSDSIHPGYLVLAAAAVAVFALIIRSARVPGPLKASIAIALAVLAWYAMFSSGVHATIAGVLLAFTVPVRSRAASGTPDAELDADAGVDPDADPATERSPADRYLEVIQPLSAGVVVPIFAFCSAGVTLIGGGLAGGLTDSVFYAIVIGLVGGKLIGIFGGTWLAVKFTHASLDESVAWIDIFGLALLGGIGFTVSLLVGDLSFGDGARAGHVKFGVLAASGIAAILGGSVLSARNRLYRRGAHR